MPSLLDYDFKSPLPHPGEILRAAYMAPLGLDADDLARSMKLDGAAVEDLVREAAPITPNIALRLERAFGGSAEYWMTLQAQHDLSREVIDHGDELSAIEGIAMPQGEARTRIEQTRQQIADGARPKAGRFKL